MPSLGADCRSEMCIQSVCKRLHLVSTSEIRSFGDEKWWRFSFYRTVTNVLARAWDERTNFRWICNDFLLFTSIPVHSMGPDSNIWWPDLSISGVGCGPALARRCFQAGFTFQRWRLKSLTFGKCFQSRMFVTVSDTYVHWIGIKFKECSPWLTQPVSASPVRQAAWYCKCNCRIAVALGCANRPCFRCIRFPKSFVVCLIRIYPKSVRWHVAWK